jgi:hypothetical protein
MKLAEAEQVFGKRYSVWEESEIREFLGALEPDEIDIPLVAKWIIERPPSLLQKHTRLQVQHTIDMANLAIGLIGGLAREVKRRQEQAGAVMDQAIKETLKNEPKN